jgi:hypothetical protein
LANSNDLCHHCLLSIYRPHMKQNEASEAREASLTELRHLSIVPFKAPVRWASLMSHGRMVAQPFFGRTPAYWHSTQPQQQSDPCARVSTSTSNARQTFSPLSLTSSSPQNSLLLARISCACPRCNHDASSRCCHGRGFQGGFRSLSGNFV